MIDAFPASLVLILGAVLMPFVGKAQRTALILGLPLIGLIILWGTPLGIGGTYTVAEYQLVLVRNDELSRVFATIFMIMAFGGGLFALRQEKTMELMAAFIYAGGAVGVAQAGDLVTVFVFWELMALASAAVILSQGTDGALKVSLRYLLVHMLGGAFLMTGILLYVTQTGSIAFVAMKAETLAVWLILIGVLLNAAAPPFSPWLPDAYPKASFSGTVFLSAFTTKTAVYVLIRGFPGTEILIVVGVIMIFYGIIYALLENDMRRILAYSIVNQVGFMVVGVGIGTEMALNGAAAHAFTHIIYKGLLLMSAGAVLYQTGKSKCTDLGGLFQSMPLTTVCGTIGALAISSFPFTSGFISKSMISQSAADQHMAFVWFMLMAASAGVFLHAGIKYPWFVFFQKDSGLRPPDPPWSMRLAMILFAVFCVGLGVWPEPLYKILPYPVDYVPYTVPHVVNMLQLLLMSGLAFFVLLPMMKRTLTITLDFDWSYRKLLPKAAHWFVETFSPVDRTIRVLWRRKVELVIAGVFRHHGPHGILARPWTIGSTAMGVALLLAVFLIAYFL
ncbi:MAG: Na(+)/H(+) antiporter subunit D [Magnetospiraceae bacterium]